MPDLKPMSGEAANPARAQGARPASEARGRTLLLTIGLAGSLLINFSGQLVGGAIADIQAGLGATADEGSLLTTVYTMALLVGIVFSIPLSSMFGLRRYMVAAALVFGATAIACALAPPIPAVIALRALQGFAAGAFGPIAFAALFVTSAGPRLPFGLALLAFILLLPGTIGPAAAGFIENGLGWQSLFLVQAAIGAGVAVAALLFMPRSPINWGALDRDWTSVVLLSIALAATLFVLGQGTRRYWLDSELIGWSLAIAAGAWAGFVFGLLRSPKPMLAVSLLGRRGFIGPIILNTLFRAGFASTAFLIPQFLAVSQGYRPLQLAPIFLWATLTQVLAFPLSWWLLQRVEGRLITGAGLLLFGLAAIVAACGTGGDAADQFRIVLALSGAGQVLFLVPNLVAGGKALTGPADGPTASLLFNASTSGGTAIGVAMATEFVTERQMSHAASLAESAAAYGPKTEEVDSFATGLGAGGGEPALGALRAVVSTAEALNREAWTLAFNDGFLVLGSLLVATLPFLLFLQRQPRLREVRATM